jgi:hypothetical protein
LVTFSKLQWAAVAQVADLVVEPQVEPTAKARQISQVVKAVTQDHSHIQVAEEEQVEPRHCSWTDQQLQQQAAVPAVVVQDNFQTVRQASIPIQQQQPHQGHWERMVRITPETVVVEVLEAVEPMEVKVERVVQEITAAVEATQVQT